MPKTANIKKWQEKWGKNYKFLTSVKNTILKMEIDYGQLLYY